MTRQDDHRQGRIRLSNLAQHGNAALLRQAYVEEDGVRTFAADGGQPLLATVGDLRLVTLVSEHFGEESCHLDVVLDEQNLHGSPRSTGICVNASASRRILCKLRAVPPRQRSERSSRTALKGCEVPKKSAGR